MIARHAAPERSESLAHELCLVAPAASASPGLTFEHAPSSDQ
jgi:hypothetical protein